MRVFILFIACLWLFTANAQTIELSGKPMQEGGYVDCSFGSFPKGKKQQYWIEIENKGDKPLNLKSLELSCDCLSASKWQTLPIPPKARIKIKLMHDAKHVGPFQLFAKLQSDASNYATLWIRLNGEVLAKKPKK